MIEAITLVTRDANGAIVGIDGWGLAAVCCIIWFFLKD